MSDLVMLLVHLITIILRPVGPGGVHAVVAESLPHINCWPSTVRAPHLRAMDRAHCWNLFALD